ncbi:hypothetical protein IFR05_001819 [Cadophora sp. M221]|nr:hypothetical protein IFR05_001819 [Cadophora sp. M221]
MRYRYPQINTYLSNTGILVGGSLVVLPVVGFILLGLFKVTFEFLEAAMNLRTVGGQTRRKCLIRPLIFLVLAAFLGFIMLLPVAAFSEGPNMVWKHQMKNSCNGLDTTISLDAYPGVPATKFIESYELGSSTKHVTKNWYLAHHLKPTAEPSDSPFQFYTRLSGRISYRPFAVDVDLEHNAWRLYQLNEYDLGNQWLAYDSKKLSWADDLPSLPKFPQLKETLLSKGTFTQATILEQEMEIPQLDMVITNMYQFLNDPEYEPFLRVFNLRGFNASIEFEEQGEKEPVDLWSSKPHAREVLRMAAFGQGRGQLTMCAREYIGYRDGKPVESKDTGIHQAELVPFAIIAAWRQRYIETGMRAKWTPFYYSGY